MADLADVRQKILKEFAEAVRKYPKPRTASGAQLYAHQVGGALRNIVKRNIGSDVLTDGFLTPEAAEALIRDPLGAGWKIVAEATGEMQTQANIAAGFHVRATAAPVNGSRVNGMVTLASSEEFEAAAPKVFQCFDNIMRVAADTTIRNNFTAMHDAGVKVEVVRIPNAGACGWCQDIAKAGPYDYEDVRRGGEVWLRHLDCACVIETRASGRSQRSYVRLRDKEEQRRVNAEITKERNR